ncbi:ATP-binding protein [Streptomyces alkaliphilus]|uniref:ATP-binding protein n=1 Tax=Streptomyces alkaliphilus TaxID=1472722 RepID=A0A7W3TB21_9ACTN|nr:ATP-binding protein [Streptomyces alkaliphilus]MBB0243574.1 ATP-binding protein [Streptomyces alkaliphilus]
MSHPLKRHIARAALVIAAGAAPVAGAAGVAHALEPAQGDLGGLSALDGAAAGEALDGAMQKGTALAGEAAGEAVKTAVPATGKVLGAATRSATPAAQETVGGAAGSGAAVLGETVGALAGSGLANGNLPKDGLPLPKPSGAGLPIAVPIDGLPGGGPLAGGQGGLLGGLPIG